MERVWFITGCSTGFGRMLAERLLEKQEERIVATARSAQTLRDLGRFDESRILRLAVDVRDEKQVLQGVATAIERFGQIDVLVNNAGYGYFATQEEGELEEVRNMYATNVFGLIATTQAVLPHMRERRSGVIVNLSSIAGRIATPRGGFYQSTKWAVEALSEAVYLEMSSFGIRVAIIEPGAYETDFATRSVRLAEAEGNFDSPYAKLREIWKNNASAKIFPKRQEPTEVVDGILEAVDSDLPFLRLPLGTDAVTLIARRREMGDTEFVEWIRKIYYDG